MAYMIVPNLFHKQKTTEYREYQGRPSHGGNEAEIFIIAVLEGVNFFGLFKGKKFVCILGEKKI